MKFTIKKNEKRNILFLCGALTTAMLSVIFLVATSVAADDNTGKVLQDIQIVQPPNQVFYALEESFLLEGMQISASYEQEEEPVAIDAMACMFEPTRFKVTGLQRVTVSYWESGITKSVSIEVVVVENAEALRLLLAPGRAGEELALTESHAGELAEYYPDAGTWSPDEMEVLPTDVGDSELEENGYALEDDGTDSVRGNLRLALHMKRFDAQVEKEITEMKRVFDTSKKIPVERGEENLSEVLAIYALLSGQEEQFPYELRTSDATQAEQLNEIFWDMTKLGLRTRGSGKKLKQVIQLERLHAADVAERYNLTAEQQKKIKGMTSTEAQKWVKEVREDELLKRLTEDDVERIVACIPEWISEERAAVLLAALSLEGKVSYLWGGKSVSIGWDPEWGKKRTIMVADENAEPQVSAEPQAQRSLLANTMPQAQQVLLAKAEPQVQAALLMNMGAQRMLVVNAESETGTESPISADPPPSTESPDTEAPQDGQPPKPAKKEKKVVMGLDCSGFVCWSMINGYGDKKVKDQIGLGSSTQWGHSKEVRWDEAQPGDWVFYREPRKNAGNHIGILLGMDADGNWLVIHCTTGKGVIVTGAKSFNHVRRPDVYTDEVDSTGNG